MTTEPIALISEHGRVLISARGAQVLEAQLGGRQLFWLNPLAQRQLDTPGAAVRGGVPLCFPWFGRRPNLPAHGFARNRDWRLLDRGPGHATFELVDDEDTRTLWPHRFRAELRVAVDESLTYTFEVTNTDTEPFEFTYALHSYFALDARTTRLEDLDGCVRTEQDVTTTQQGPVTFDRPIDAIFENAPDRLLVRDDKRAVGIVSLNMASAVAWNPGPNDMADIGDEWHNFVCVERGRIGRASVTLAPGERHTSSMQIVSEPGDGSGYSR